MGSRAELSTVMLYEGGGQKYYPLPMGKYSKIKGMINGQATFEHADESMGFGTYAIPIYPGSVWICGYIVGG